MTNDTSPTQPPDPSAAPQSQGAPPIQPPASGGQPAAAQPQPPPGGAGQPAAAVPAAQPPAGQSADAGSVGSPAATTTGAAAQPAQIPAPEVLSAAAARQDFLHAVKSSLAVAAATIGAAATVFVPHVAAPPGNLDVINGCSMVGKPVNQEQTQLNPLKNRYTIPDPSQVSPLDLNTMLNSMEGGLDQSKAVTVDGYITRVKQGGIESCNCGTDEPTYMDTHIYVNTTPQFDEAHAVIVEVTPRIRQEKAGAADWSTPALISALPPGTRARITGWLFYDKEHENAATNTNPNGAHNWRGTCWEIHPVTDIETEPSVADSETAP